MYTEKLSCDSDSTDSETDIEEYTVIQNEAGGAYIHSANLRNIQIGDGRITVVTGGRGRRKHEDRPKTKPSESKTCEVKIELINSISQPSTGDLNYVCSNIGKSWKKLGRALGVPKTTIETIEMDFHVEGVYEMAWQTILRWRRKKGNDVKLRDLARVLDEIGLTKIAKELPVG